MFTCTHKSDNIYKSKKMHRHLTINMDFENFFNFLNNFYLEERLNVSKFVSALQNL